MKDGDQCKWSDKGDKEDDGEERAVSSKVQSRQTWFQGFSENHLAISPQDVISILRALNDFSIVLIFRLVFWR